MGETAWASGAVVVDGIRLGYHRTGGDGKPVLVLLHGITDDGLCWTRVARDLEAHHDIVMPDARGHGRSDGVETGFSIPRLASDVAGLLDGLRIENAVVFGHSMGAATALSLAASRPGLVRACILEDPPLEGPTTPSSERLAEMRADAALWRKLPPAQRYERAAARNPGWDRQETDAWADAKALVDPAIIEQFGSIRGWDWREALSRLRCPGLLITGNRALQAIVSAPTAEAVIRLWPAGQIVHVSGAGHCVHRDRWEETMGPVRSFLQEQAPGRA
jgi:pimeloyl-ACP methyl ester carboxylesterase